MKTKLPEVLRVKGVLYSYTDYPQGSIERAKALFADMWDKSQLTETVISGWDDAKARILKEKAWEKLGYPDPETVLREIFGERYDLVELGKVHLGPDKLVTEAEEEGRRALASHGNPLAQHGSDGRFVKSEESTEADNVSSGIGRS